MFMTLGLVVLRLALLLLAVPVGFLALEVTAASIPSGRRRGDDRSPAAAPSVAVLIPARNEAAGIAATIASVRAQLRPGDRLLVVADNCSDDTAKVAREAGADVVERFDAERRGKGYALDCGIRALSASPPGVVIVIDADCGVSPGALHLLASRAHASQRPVQGLYLMLPPSPPSLRQRVAGFAWIIRNQVRPIGAARLGLPCHLMGSGMALPWPVLQRVSMATGHLVEDLKLGVDLALTGSPPLFEPEALVISEFPVSAAAAQAQRTRWQHGHLDILTHLAPRLLWRAITRRDAAALTLAGDLLVPPLSLLVLVVLGVTLPVLVGGALDGFGASSELALAILATFVATVLLAWARHGQAVLSIGDLLRAPAFALKAIPVYVQYLVHRQTEWVRTRRKSED